MNIATRVENLEKKLKRLQYIVSVVAFKIVIFLGYVFLELKSDKDGGSVSSVAFLEILELVLNAADLLL